MNQLLFSVDAALVADSQILRKLRVNNGMYQNGGEPCVALNEKLLEEVECFEYLRPNVAVDEGINGEVKSRMNKVVKLCEGMKCFNVDHLE